MSKPSSPSVSVLAEQGVMFPSIEPCSDISMDSKLSGFPSTGREDLPSIIGGRIVFQNFRSDLGRTDVAKRSQGKLVKPRESSEALIDRIVNGRGSCRCVFWRLTFIWDDDASRHLPNFFILFLAEMEG